MNSEIYIFFLIVFLWLRIEWLFTYRTKPNAGGFRLPYFNEQHDKQKEKRHDTT